MRTSVARRESLLGEFEKSGLSAKKFAELSGIKYQTLATWLQKRRKQGKTPVKAANAVKWLEAVVEQAQNPVPHASSSVVLRLPGGTQIELADVKQIPMAAALVRALAQPC
jgi:transcriptional regulator with XRE-family HTH domain